MRKIIILFVALMMLSGCSVGTITSKPPIFTGKSQKKPAEVVRCLAPKMSDLNPSATTMETDTGYRIVVSVSDVGASVVAIVNADGEGSEVKMHAFTAGYGNPWGKMAMACL
ncbi:MULTISPECIES: lipoprotein [Enterobacter cloacae complex]|uniref:lipoprotein n=1 Tax=Enterobacter cloacae complex TaxID=354276 RepID=UPI00131EE802|nr:lipoprotein [Enterobacter ludwigii]